jgi:hypothetical protein
VVDDVVEPLELDELDWEPVPDDDVVVAPKTPGIENGSRPPKKGIGEGPGDGVRVGVGVCDPVPVPPPDGGGSVSSPPPSRFITRTPARRTPATIPPIVSVRRSRALSGIGYPASVGPGSELGPALESLV